MNENSCQSEPPPSFSSSDPNQYEPDHNRHVQQQNHPVDDCQTGDGFSAMLMESSGSSPRSPRYTNLTANNSESLQHHQSTSHIMVPLVQPNYSNSNDTYGDDEKQIPHSKVRSPAHSRSHFSPSPNDLCLANYINYPVHGMVPIHHPPMHPMVLHRENSQDYATNSEHIVWFQGSSPVALENGPLDLRGQSVSPAENVNNFHNWNYPTSVITTGKRTMHPEYIDMTSHQQQHHPPIFPEFQENDATVIGPAAATIKLTSKRVSSGFSRSSVSSSYRGHYSSHASKGRLYNSPAPAGSLLSSQGSKTRLNLDCEEQFKVDNEALVNMPVRHLNKLIKDLTKEKQDKYKKLRRQLKNRKYASNCRSKRCNMKKNLDAENEKLEIELKGLQHTLNAKTKEERYLREMLEGLNFRSRGVRCDGNEIEEHAQIRERSEFGERSIIITNTINNNNNNNNGNNHNNDFMSMA